MSYTFQQWNDSSTSNPRSFPMLWQDTTFTATFITQYLLTSSASPAPGGQVTGTGWYTPPANVTVAAIANPGYSFTGLQRRLERSHHASNRLDERTEERHRHIHSVAGGGAEHAGPVEIRDAERAHLDHRGD